MLTHGKSIISSNFCFCALGHNVNWVSDRKPLLENMMYKIRHSLVLPGRAPNTSPLVQIWRCWDVGARWPPWRGTGYSRTLTHWECPCCNGTSFFIWDEPRAALSRRWQYLQHMLHRFLWLTQHSIAWLSVPAPHGRGRAADGKKLLGPNVFIC